MNDIDTKSDEAESEQLVRSSEAGELSKRALEMSRAANAETSDGFQWAMAGIYLLAAAAFQAKMRSKLDADSTRAVFLTFCAEVYDATVPVTMVGDVSELAFTRGGNG